jgi:hypothetical protein
MMRAVSALLAITVLTACSDPSSVQVASAKSPNGHVEAIVAETNGGATVDFGYEISVRSSPSGAPTRVASLYGAIRSEQAYGVNLVWVGERTLEIQYLRAKSAKLERGAVTLDGQSFAVRLKPGLLDASAPAGGMEYSSTHKAQ